MAEIEATFTPAQIERLAAKLDALSEKWTDEEKSMLVAVFALAQQAVTEMLPEEEVEGFATSVGGRGSLSSVGQGFASAFTPGGPSGLGGAAMAVKVEPTVDPGVGVKIRIPIR